VPAPSAARGGVSDEPCDVFAPDPPDEPPRERRRRDPDRPVDDAPPSTVETVSVRGAVTMRPFVPAGMSRSVYRCGLDEYVSVGSG
jgi:hypothetical protein